MFERIYHKVGNILRVLLYTNLPITVANAEYLIDQALATEMNYMRVNFTTTPKGSPGYLLFDREFFLDISLIVDCQMIQQHRQNVVN